MIGSMFDRGGRLCLLLATSCLGPRTIQNDRSGSIFQVEGIAIFMIVILNSSIAAVTEKSTPRFLAQRALRERRSVRRRRPQVQYLLAQSNS